MTLTLTCIHLHVDVPSIHYFRPIISYFTIEPQQQQEHNITPYDTDRHTTSQPTNQTTIMPTLLSLPPELRQHILSPCLPADVHNAGVAPRTAALLPLLLTCRAVRLDVLELLRSWSPLYHIEDPRAFYVRSQQRGQRGRDDDDDVAQMRRVSLRLFADLDLKRMRRVAPLGAHDEGCFDVDAWLRCVGALPRPGDGDGAGAVESVVLDLTPVPVWMATWRPDWVRANVLDARNRPFLVGCEDGVRKIAAALFGVYEGAGGVSISLGGAVPSKARRVVEAGLEILDPRLALEAQMGRMSVLDAGAGGKVPFAGEYIKGPADEPTRLRLGLVCLCWGVDVRGLARGDYAFETRLIQIRNEARKNGLATPELDFRALGWVYWSKQSSTAYFVNAEADERRTRDELVRMLAFAVGVRTETAGPGATVDFEPAIRVRRFLLHCLARDLELASVSVGDAGEKFVRVSRPVEKSVEEVELPGGDGGDGGHVHGGDEEVMRAELRAIQLRRAFRRCSDERP
ncbi:hypothetical protein KVR01_004670 [Diaporthe batatas]|uniref:uncharacterized protein n=1 Tax=Diaporthe batatas TaxID=748121 RepID=UPI001D044432|nr:uncharacterized protein KVR01_004670 [Diaporthe batatas]KAG8166118.1 hypothetical protein KVR01_004670 [Diaporthe batatas]